MAEHTPGPWIRAHLVSPLELDLYQGVLPEHDMEHPDWGVCHVGNRRGPEEALANARLIAAAPELLMACKDVAEAHGYPPDDEGAPTWLMNVWGAIAKAEGRATA